MQTSYGGIPEGIWTAMESEMTNALEKTPNTQVANQTGVPAMSVPLHWNAAGLPIGVFLMEVLPGGPADDAGLQGTRRSRSGDVLWGDRIIAIGKEKIESYDDLYNVLSDYEVGQAVEVIYMREGAKRSTKVKLVDINE